MGSSCAGMIKKLIGKDSFHPFIHVFIGFGRFFDSSILYYGCFVELTSDYAASRKQFNRSLSEFGMIQVQWSFPSVECGATFWPGFTCLINCFPC